MAGGEGAPGGDIIQSERRWAGGKGVNVARWLRHLEENPTLLLPLGGNSGKEMAGYLRQEKLPAKSISLYEATRVNVIVTAGDGSQLRFNPPGPRLSVAEWKSVLGKTGRLLTSASCLVLSGSLPGGVGTGAYAELIRLARRAGVKTILDCDGAALAAAVKAGPLLVKPNEHELAEWYGRSIKTRAALVRAAGALSAKTKGWVLVSLGRRGALLINRKLGIELAGKPAAMKPVNTVGAGDAMVAAVARRIELDMPPEDWLRWGVAVGTAATQCAAGKPPPNALITRTLRRVKIA